MKWTDLHQDDPVIWRVIGHARQHHEVDWLQGCSARTAVEFSWARSLWTRLQLTDDGPIYHAHCVHLFRAKFDDRYSVARFFTFRVRGKVPERSSHIFVVTWISLKHIGQKGLRAKIRSKRLAVSIEHRLVTDTVRQSDRQTDRQTNRQTDRQTDQQTDRQTDIHRTRASVARVKMYRF